MFDLNREVAAWSEAVHAERCRREAGVAELTDHLYCEIERGRAQGMTDEQAFRAAIARLGGVPELKAENAKSATLAQAACAVTARFARPGAGREERAVLIANGILWAAVFIATALTAKVASHDWLGWMLLSVLMPGWWASELILRRALRAKGA